MSACQANMCQERTQLVVGSPPQGQGSQDNGHSVRQGDVRLAGAGQDALMLALYALQAWRGAPLSLLCTLALVCRPVNVRWLGRNSGYSNKPVAQALRYLEERGLADKSDQGWQLSQHGRQLLLRIASGFGVGIAPRDLPVEDAPEAIAERTEQAETTADAGAIADRSDLADGRPGLCFQDEERCDPVDGWKFSAPATAVNDLIFKITQQSSSSRGAGVQNSPKTASQVYENRLVLQKAGVGEPKLSSLARMPGLQATDIRAWVAHLSKRRGGECGPGLLIHVLETGQPPPHPYDGSGALTQEERDLRRRDYAKWEHIHDG